MDTIIINHIKAHQDIPDNPDDPMRCAIKLNKEADWLAGTAHMRHIIPHDNPTKYPAGTVHVYCQTEQIHEGVHRKTRDLFNDEPIITYLQDRFSWRTETFDSIWWSIHRKALKRFKPISRLILQKFNRDHWACNHRDSVFGDPDMKWCELCHHQEETCDHILKCSHATRQAGRNELINGITNYIKRTGTPPAMKTCILHGIQSRLTDQAPSAL